MEFSKPNRRTVLKNFGVAAAGLTAYGTGTASAGGKLEIVIWKQRSSDDYEADNHVFPALADFLEQLAAEDAVGDYSLRVEPETLNEKFGLSYDDSDCDDDTWWDNFRQEIRNSSYDEDVHVAVTDQTKFANAQGECWGSHDQGFAMVGTEGGWDSTDEDVERYKNAAIQETGHVIINENHITNNEDLDHPEHALGRLKVTDWDNYTGPSTPLVVFDEEEPGYNGCYELGEEATNGECASGDWVDWDGTHVRDVTDCTIQAVKDTYRYDGY
jgi:hypothetical protein